MMKLYACFASKDILWTTLTMNVILAEKTVFIVTEKDLTNVKILSQKFFMTWTPKKSKTVK